jgi:hypothetical protein
VTSTGAVISIVCFLSGGQDASGHQHQPKDAWRFQTLADQAEELDPSDYVE